MIFLNATNENLELETSAAGSIDYSTTFVDVTSTDTAGGATQGNITTATTTIIVAAPAASTSRRVRAVTVVNKGTSAVWIRLKKDVGGTEYTLTGLIALQSGEFFRVDSDGLNVYDVTGRPKTEREDVAIAQPFSVFKIGTAPEAAGQFYSFSKDSGAPGAWSPGTPGINGRITDGNAAADAGCINFPVPSSGNYYLGDANFAATVACQVNLHDTLWINTALGVTTTTAQAITQPTLPARDNNGTTNGEGVYAAILVTTATTNAGVITTITLSYTNSDGVAGRTATISSFPATAVAGTVVIFQLAAGDKGVRSIQSITLGTTLGGGAISLILFRQVFSQSLIVANAGGTAVQTNKEVRLYNGSCILPVILASGTGAVTINGTVYLKNK